MNTLSWLLYFADVLYSQTAFLVVVSLVVPLGYILCRVFSAISAENIYSWDTKELIERKKKRQGESFINNWRFFIIPVLVLFTLNFIPSRDTFYLIVASEAGEYVASTPEAVELMSDVKEVVKAQLEALKANP